MLAEDVQSLCVLQVGLHPSAVRSMSHNFDESGVCCALKNKQELGSGGTRF